MTVLIVEPDNGKAEQLSAYFRAKQYETITSGGLIDAHTCMRQYNIGAIAVNQTLVSMPLSCFAAHIKYFGVRIALCFYQTAGGGNTAENWILYNMTILGTEIPDDFSPFFTDLEGFFTGKSRQEEKPESKTVQIGDSMAIDFAQRHIIKNDKKTVLRPLTCSLLELFFRNRNEPLSLDRICTLLWGNNDTGKRNCVYVYINTLRKALEDDPKNPVFLLHDGKNRYRFTLPERKKTTAPDGTAPFTPPCRAYTPTQEKFMTAAERTP